MIWYFLSPKTDYCSPTNMFNVDCNVTRRIFSKRIFQIKNILPQCIRQPLLPKSCIRITHIPYWKRMPSIKLILLKYCTYLTTNISLNHSFENNVGHQSIYKYYICANRAGASPNTTPSLFCKTCVYENLLEICFNKNILFFHCTCT